MVSRFRSLCAAVAIAMPLVVVQTSPATAADADVLVVQGSGTISPGLELVVPGPQSVSFTGTATVVGTHGLLATYPCSFSGSFLAAILVTGTGTMSGQCGPIAFSACIVAWAGGEWMWHCTDIGIVSAETTTWDCVFTPTNSNPTTSYDLVCGGVYASAP